MRVTYFYAVMQSDCRGVVPSPGFSKSPLMPGKGKGAWMDKLCLCTEKSDLTNIWCSFACNSILSTWAVKQLGFWLFRGIGKRRTELVPFLYKSKMIECTNWKLVMKHTKEKISYEGLGPLVILEYSFLRAQKPFVSLFPPSTNQNQTLPKIFTAWWNIKFVTNIL